MVLLLSKKNSSALKIQPFPPACFHAFSGTTASADFCIGALLRQFARLHLRSPVQTSHGKLLFVPVKTAEFTIHCLRLAVGLPCPMPSRPNGKPYILFLFVDSHLCRLLPSDPSSRWTPLHLAMVPAN